MAQRSHGASRTRSGDLLGAIQAVVGVDRPVMLTPPPTMPAETPTPRRLLFGLAPTRSRVDVLLTPPPAMPAETSPPSFSSSSSSRPKPRRPVLLTPPLTMRQDKTTPTMMRVSFTAQPERPSPSVWR
jgi:hypothetical protein